MLGLAFAVASAVSASLGTIVASRNHRHKLPALQMNAYGMAFGACLTLVGRIGADRAGYTAAASRAQ